MEEENQLPETLQEAIQYFSNPDNALDFMRSMRWQNGIVKCPYCQSESVSFLTSRRIWKCMGCKKQFSVKVGTVMEDSPIGLDKWLSAFWLIANAKNGISSYEIHRALGVTQKTGWFLLHRIRLAMQDDSVSPFSGRVEVDETFIGAKARNMHKGKRKVKGRGPVGMTAVMGLLERTTAKKPSRVSLKVVPTIRKPELQSHVRDQIVKGSEVFTDSLRSYDGLQDAYTHQVIDHAECYAKGHVHTNGLENFWSLLKRTINGTYVSVEPFHLFRYLDEQSFRFNERKDDDAGRFVKAISGMFGKGLRYAKLTSNLPETWETT